MQNKKTLQFIEKAKNIHGDKYDYLLVEYISGKKKVQISCKEHGIFEQVPDNHLKGQKCPRCAGKNKTIDDILIDFANTHGDMYDYSKVIYKGVDTKCIIICKEHGEFLQSPATHRKGAGCPQCGYAKATKSKYIKLEDFLLKANDTHGDKYDYSLVEPKCATDKITIICKEHGEFNQVLHLHVSGNGCPKCGLNVRANKKRKTTNFFLEQAIKTHGDTYDYSLSEYLGKDYKVKIICKEHGEFEQYAGHHIKGSGCPKCNGKNKTTDDVINEFIEIHGDKYDYSEVQYTGTKNKIKIICKEHGVFEQVPSSHRSGGGCPRCRGFKKTTEEFIETARKIHGDRYDYSQTTYVNSSIKLKIICKKHGEFLQSSSDHLSSKGCSKCSGQNINFLSYADAKIHLAPFKLSSGTEYYNYVVASEINLPKNAEQYYNKTNEWISFGDFLSNGKIANQNREYITYEEFKNFTYTLNFKNREEWVSYTRNNELPFNVPIAPQGTYRNSGWLSWGDALGYDIGYEGNWHQNKKLALINSLEFTDLLTMDPFEIYTIIGQGKLPVDFGTLATTDAGSDERITTLRELKERFSGNEIEEETNTAEIENIEINDNEIVQIDDVDSETTPRNQAEPRLPHMNLLGDLHSLDNNIYATMDKEAFDSLIQYKLRKLWNSVLNSDVTIETLQSETGGEYFTTIKNLFIEEYDDVCHYQPKKGYSFKYQPNLMQKLTVLRLLKNKSYGNWSGTGAGKTLSFIVASREIESKLTVIIALNSTIKQTCKSIKEVYPNSKTYTDYQEGFVFDRTKHNYLVLNYEKFQQEYSEGLFQDLTNNNQIDFVVIDEVHNAKQRQEDDESKRREVMNRLLGRIREKNTDLYTLVMSATPVVNNLYEAKSLLQLMTGLDYNDIDTRRTLGNALKIFQQLILNGLRFIPKYDIEMSELTGSNMTNLNIDGGYLLETILELPQSNYIAIEKLLLDDKLKAITPYLRKGVILYSYFTTGFINEIEAYVKSQGFSVGTYTGEESPYIREENLEKFIAGELDILIGSRPIGTGVDGLQEVSNRMILLTLPWTDSEYTQLKGRIYRQGSLFGSVEIIIPQVRINLEDGDFWSWDVQRLNVIKNKKTLADAAVDGIVPSRVLPTANTMFKKSQESLQRWKDRVNGGNLIELTRNAMQINLYPEIADDEQRQARIQSELSEFNRRGKTTKSSTMHKEFTKNPDSWHRYHALRKERMGQWDEVPYEYIATKIRNRNHKVIDFGCGENLFKGCIPHNEVLSFDHVSHNGSIACDMKDVSKWVENEFVDVCVFSLALWGTNYKDYIAEAYRTLNYGGVIHIAEPAKDYETPELEQELKTLIEEVGFRVVGDIERRSKFIYITGMKM